MPITSDQRAIIGNAYIAEIKRRIDVRSKSKALLPEPILTEGLRSSALPSIEKLIRRINKNASDIVIVSVSTSLHCHGPNESVVHVRFRDHGKVLSVAFDRALVPEVAGVDQNNKDLAAKRKALCVELEFLTTNAIAASCVAGFQAHASRLLSVAKDVDPTRPALALVDDFLTSRRGFSCTL